MMLQRKKHIKFIDHIKEKTGYSLTAIANNAAIADSTLTRFIAKDNFKALSPITLDKIAKVGGYKTYEEYLIQNHIHDNKEVITFSDAEKYETYDLVKNILAKHKILKKPSEITKLTDNVLEAAEKLGNKFISESLIMYVIESSGVK